MGKQRYAFSPKGVLRLVEWSLVQEYFAARRLLSNVPALSLDEPDLNALVDAMLALPPADQTNIEQDFQDIYALADNDGLHMIYEEARHRGEDLTAVLTEHDTPHNAAMWTLIYRESLFAELIRFRTADTLNQRYWRRRWGVPAVTPQTQPEALQRLSRRLTDYLVRREGRGQRCFVEWLRRSTGFLFIAYPEDFGETVLEYEGEDLIRRKIRPARDLLFFYSPEQGLLEVFCHGTRDKVEDLQQLFAQIILGTVLPPDPASSKAYKLNALKRDDFAFVFDRGSGLDEIVVKWVHLRDQNNGPGITLEVNGQAGRGVVFAAQKYFGVNPGETTDKYPLDLMDVDRARLQAHLRPTSRQRRGRSKTFSVSNAGCALDQEGFDGLIRRALKDSGLDAEPIRDLVAV